MRNVKGLGRSSGSFRARRWAGMGRYVEFAGSGSSHPCGAVQQAGFDGSLSEFIGHSRRSTSKGRFRKPPTFTAQDRVTLISLKLTSNVGRVLRGSCHSAYAARSVAVGQNQLTEPHRAVAPLRLPTHVPGPSGTPHRPAQAGPVQRPSSHRGRSRLLQAELRYPTGGTA